MAKIKKPIAIVFSDIHLNLWNYKTERRIDDGKSLIKNIYTKAKLFKIPVLFTGDLIHKEKQISNKLLSILLPLFNRIWDKSKVETYAISGNHDQCEESTLNHISPSYINTFSKVFKNLNCIDHKSVKCNGMMLHGIPYLTHDLNIGKAIKNRVKNIDKKLINILLIHTTLDGSLDTDGRGMDSNIESATNKLFKEFDLVITGHIHKPMKISKNIYQIGATNHQRKTDKNSELGYVLLYDDLSVEFVPLDYPKFVQLEYNEKHPDNKHFYYNKEKPIKKNKHDTNHDFSETTDYTKLAKNYIKEKGINDKAKKKALITILNK